MLGHHRIEVRFHFDTSEIPWPQKDIIAFQQFNIRVSCLKIAINQHKTLSSKDAVFFTQKPIDLFKALNWALYINKLHQLDSYMNSGRL